MHGKNSFPKTKKILCSNLSLRLKILRYTIPPRRGQNNIGTTAGSLAFTPVCCVDLSSSKL